MLETLRAPAELQRPGATSVLPKDCGISTTDCSFWSRVHHVQANVLNAPWFHVSSPSVVLESAYTFFHVNPSTGHCMPNPTLVHLTLLILSTANQLVLKFGEGSEGIDGIIGSRPRHGIPIDIVSCVLDRSPTTSATEDGEGCLSQPRQRLNKDQSRGKQRLRERAACALREAADWNILVRPVNQNHVLPRQGTVMTWARS